MWAKSWAVDRSPSCEIPDKINLEIPNEVNIDLAGKVNLDHPGEVNHLEYSLILSSLLDLS